MNCKVEEVQKIRVDNSIELAYEFIKIDKAEDAPLLIFLHEGLGSIAQWKSFPIELCQKLNLNGFIYERYGYGHSTPLLAQRTADYLHREADYFLPRLLEKLKLTQRKLILVGHSDGASIALIYAALFPENIAAVISMAAHVFVDELSLKAIKEMDAYYAKTPEFKNKLKKYHFDHVDSTFYAWSKIWLTKEFSHFNIEHLLPKIEAPILAIQGKEDQYGLPRQVHSIVNNGGNNNNEKLFIKNVTHSPHIEAEKEVLKSITQFIAKNKSNE